MKNTEISIIESKKSAITPVSEQFRHIPLAAVLPQISLVSELKKYTSQFEERLEFLQSDNSLPAESSSAAERSMLEQALGWLELQSND